MRQIVTRSLAALAVLALAGHAAWAQAACASLPRQAAGDLLDLAPPPGYTDVCAEDASLCRLLTAGYPPSVTTLAYLVPTADWEAFQQDRVRGFPQYLIGQLAGRMRAADLPGFKAHVRAQQGDIADHTEPPPAVEVRDRTPLGILAETDRSISFGILMRMQPAGQPDVPPDAVVATNSAVAVGDRILSLYVFRGYRTAADIEAAKELTRAWLTCIGQADAAARPAAPSDDQRSPAP